jgi:hypothetical protein
MTVFTIPPRDVRLEIRDQFPRAREGVCPFPTTEVPMVTLAALVVISDYAFAIDHIGKPIFVWMPRWGKRLGKQPYNILREATIGVRYPSVQDRYRLHVGYFANTDDRCQCSGAKCGVRQPGCKSWGWSGSIARAASRGGCGSAILMTNTLFVIGAAVAV